MELQNAKQTANESRQNLALIHEHNFERCKHWIVDAKEKGELSTICEPMVQKHYDLLIQMGYQIQHSWFRNGYVNIRWN
jgi:hypothetical protein